MNYRPFSNASNKLLLRSGKRPQTHATVAAPAHDHAVYEKLLDALTLGFCAEFDPLEAEAIGCFHEDALSEADAMDSTHDILLAPPAAKAAPSSVLTKKEMQ